MTRGPALLAALMLASFAARAAGAAFEVDGRIELLSAVLLLSAENASAPSPDEPDDAYRREARAAFAGFKDHPAVARAALLRRDGAALTAAARLMFRLSPAPELAASGPIPEEDLAPLGGKKETEAFLDDLRDFARRSDFKSFDEAHRPAYGAIVAAAEEETLHAMSPASVAAYMGLPPQNRPRDVLAPLFPGEPVDEPIARDGGRAVHLRPRVRANGKNGFLLDTFEHSAARELAYDASSWVSPPSAEIRAALADAVGLRVIALDLGERAYRELLGRAPGARQLQLESLGESLKEYEAGRGRYPDLRSFYPRLEPLSPLRLDEAAWAAKAGDRRAALDALADAEKLTTGRASRLRIASLYAVLQEYGRARRVLEALAAAAPEDAGLRVDLAALLVQAGERDSARAALDSARRLGPDAEQTRRLALLYQDLKEYGRAAGLLEPLARENPKDASLLADLGLCRQLAGRGDEAIADLKAAIKLAPDSLGPYLTLGAIYADRRQYGRAAGVYASAPPRGGDPALRALLEQSLGEARARAPSGLP